MYHDINKVDYFIYNNNSYMSGQKYSLVTPNDNNNKDTSDGKNSEYKILSSFDFESNQSFFNFIYENDIQDGPELDDITFFSIYYYVTRNEKRFIYSNFREVLRNLKKLILLKNEITTPIFYYDSILKSFIYLSTFTENTVLSENINSEILEEFLDFVPMLYKKLLDFRNNIKYETMIQKCLNEISNLNCNLPINLNKFSIVNRQIINRYMKNFFNFENNSKFKQKKVDLNEDFKQEKPKSYFNNRYGNKKAYYKNNNHHYKKGKHYEEEKQKESDVKSSKAEAYIEEKPKKDEIKINNQNEEQKDKNSQVTPNKNAKEVKEIKLVKEPIKIPKKEFKEIEAQKENEIHKEVILLTKMKKFSDNHMTKDKFRVKYIAVNSLSEVNIINTLTEVADDFFKTQKAFSSLQLKNLEIETLKREYSEQYTELALDLIGSISLGTYSNIENRAAIDFVIRPVESGRTTIKNLMSIISTLINFNEENDSKAHKFICDDLKGKHLKNYFCNVNLWSEKSQNVYSANIFIFREELKISNEILLDIFKLEKLKALHVFFQDIFINKIKLCEYGSDVSLLIVAFLDFYCNILNKDKRIDRKYSTLQFKDVHGDNRLDQLDIKYMPLEIVTSSCFYYQIDQENYKKIKDIDLGELILEFFRFVLNMLNFLKFEYNKSTTASNYDYLCKIFKNDYLNSDEYILNIQFMFELLKEVKDFSKIITNLINQAADILFKICENPLKIRNYDHIIQNIIKIDEAK